MKIKTPPWRKVNVFCFIPITYTKELEKKMNIGNMKIDNKKKVHFKLNDTMNRKTTNYTLIQPF